MEKEAESVVSLEIRSGTVYLFSTESLYQYSTETFLCEIYEKLTERFEDGVQSNEFFNYADPKSAWQLLSDYFEKTNYLKKQPWRILMISDLFMESASNTKKVNHQTGIEILTPS